MPRIVQPGQAGSSLWVNVPVPQPVQSGGPSRRAGPGGQQSGTSPQAQQQQPMPAGPPPVPEWVPPPLLILPHAPEADGPVADQGRARQQFRRIRFGLPEDVGDIARSMGDGLWLPAERSERDHALVLADRLEEHGLEHLPAFLRRAWSHPGVHPMTITQRVRHGPRSPYNSLVSQPMGHVRVRLNDAPGLVATVHAFEGQGGNRPLERPAGGLRGLGRPHFEIHLAHDTRGRPGNMGQVSTLGTLHTADHKFVQDLVAELDRHGSLGYEGGQYQPVQAMAERTFRGFLRATHGLPLRRPQLKLARVQFNRAPGGQGYRPRKARRWRYDDEAFGSIGGTEGAARVALRRGGAPVRFAAGQQQQPALKPPAAGHDGRVKAVVADYVRKNAQRHGLLPYRDTPRRPVDEALSRRTADAFAAAPHAPHDPETARAYKQLMGEVKDQFDHIAAHGVRMEPWLAKGQPYKDSSEMFADVRGNNHLWFFPTINPHELASFGQPGGDLDPHTNPLVEKSGHVVNGHPLTYNDLLRAVHDYAAHASVGNTFGPVGEYNAWAEHAKMFSPLAIRALTTETHGQNSWVNFGSHIRRPDGSVPKPGEPDFVPQTKRPFADQKVFLLPPDAIPPHPYPELDHTIHGRGQGPERFGQFRAPAGGMVTRGIFDPGGRFVPPEATGQRPNTSRVRALVRRLLSKRKRVTSGVIPGTSPGAGYPQPGGGVA